MRLDALLKEGERGYAIVLEVEVWVRVDANWRSRERVVSFSSFPVLKLLARECWADTVVMVECGC